MGSSSSSTVNETSTVINSYSNNFSANCGSSTSATNAIIITGTGNSINKVVQAAKSGTSTTCEVYNPQSAASAATLSMSASAIAATIAQQFSGLLDDSNSSASTNISTTLSNTINQNAVFDCAVNVLSANLLLVDGSGNIINNTNQSATTNAISSCTMSGGQSASVVANVAQASNASSSDTIQSIFQPFVTMFQSLMVDLMVAAVAFIIFIVLVVIIYKMLESTPKNVTSNQPLVKTT